MLRFLPPILVVVFPALAFAAKPANPWSKFRTPAPGTPLSIGKPSAGCLRGAEPLKESGPGYVLARPERRRNYGHPRLIAILKGLGTELVVEKKPPILVGDLSQPRGGPTLSAHASHQSGLDVDIWFSRPKAGTPKRASWIREHVAAEKMVDASGFKTDAGRFGETQIDLLRRLASREEVDRILVNFPLKKYLCEHHAAEAWIRKIRPWYGHDHHFHVRVRCPADDRACVAGEPIPEGNGCDATLEWWWSAEARGEEKKNSDREGHPVMPELPKECATLASP